MNTDNKGNNSRREFVKNSTLVAGGLLAAPLMSRANYFSGADDTIKIALVGCGGRGTGAAIQALSTKQNVKLVAVADAFKDRLDNSLKSMKKVEEIDASRIDVPEDRQFVGFDGYLKAIPLADVVILATPPGFRPLHFEAAIKLNKHVFMEKPVATDPAGINKVLATAQLAKARKLNVVVGLQRHYQNSYRELFKRKDLIGDITSAQCWWNGDGVWVRPRQEGQTEMEYQMRNWYYFNWLCGDHITEQHVHNIDVVNWFKGAYPIKAQGMGGREVRTGKEYGEIFDHHFVEFHYADGTILNSQCRHQPKTMSKVDELIVGTKGKIFAGAANIVDYKGKVLYQFDKKTENDPYQSEHDELFAAIAKGEYKFADAENGAKSTMSSILGRMATYSGQVIELDKALASNIDLQPREYSWSASPGILPDANGFYPVAVPGTTSYA
ncbi:MAG: Gfo/Idh/MocA family oxidoreductase [Chitinophagaceae bacterium]|nr:Gfo/Idh/MocA family oxidoreductase [Chitinophagaceae bacterium]MCW5926920.1 Gfo/Idh/MocA family oxidoreductase [Chitinophagaceae bacterium]